MTLVDVIHVQAKAILGGSRSPTNSRGADRVLSRRLNTPAQPSRQRTAGVSALTGDAPPAERAATTVPNAMTGTAGSVPGSLGTQVRR